MKFFVSAWLVLLTGCLIAALPAVAQLSITSPTTRAVFQRGNDNVSTIYVSGTFSQPVNRVEARLVVMNPNQGVGTDWMLLQDNPQGGIFQGGIRALGGWYRLEVRGMLGGSVVGQASVERIGVGEVFVITGQSNAQGFQDRGAAGAADDRVNCVSYDTVTANSLADPPLPEFRQLSSDALIGPRGQSAWCWGLLGDFIANRYNVPVLFINTAWAATSIRNWEESARGVRTKNIYNSLEYPVGMPYANLVIALRYYASLQGMRAVLWQQGETDNVPLRVQQAEYQALMQYLINKTREDTKRYPAWVLARSSLTTDFNTGIITTSQAIINAQNAVITTFNNNVYAGPFTDNIQVPRPDGVHFSGDGLRQLAEAWFSSLNAQFFSSSIPLLPLPSPSLNVACNGDNRSLTLTVAPEVRNNAEVYRIQDITWSNGQKGPTLTVSAPGTYRAVVKDEKNTTFLTPAVTVTGSLQPTVPAIQPAGQLQVCSDSTLALSTNAPTANAILWSVGTNARSIRVGTAGTYTARAQNVFGCTSAASAPVNLTVRPRLPIPTVEKVGVYSLRAMVPMEDVQYEWRADNQTLAPTGDVLKAVRSGRYVARARKVYTLEGNNLTCVSNFSPGIDFVVSDASKGLAIYPNPAQGQVFVETREDVADAVLSVVTLTGQVVYSEKVGVFNNRRELNLTGLHRGVYLIQVRGTGFSASKRIWIK